MSADLKQQLGRFRPGCCVAVRRQLSAWMRLAQSNAHRAIYRFRARDSFSIVVNFDQSWVSVW